MNETLLMKIRKVIAPLSSVPSDQWEQFSAILRERHIEKNDYFIRAGQVPPEFGFVASGLMRLYYLTEEGNEFTKAFCLENSFVTSYSALLLNKPSGLFIQALENTVLLVGDFDEFRKLYNKHICWQELGRKIAENLFIKKEERESPLLLDSAEIRYTKFLKEYPLLDKRIPQYHIASYLGITPVALSRIRARRSKTSRSQ